MNVNVKKLANFGELELPKYQTNGSAGLDLRAAIDNDLVLKSMEMALVPTGLAFELPIGTECQIRPRSGISKQRVLIYLGTVDCDFSGECKITIQNLSDKDFIIKRGDRLAQMVISQYVHIELSEVNELRKTARGERGWGSTGIT